MFAESSSGILGDSRCSPLSYNGLTGPLFYGWHDNVWSFLAWAHFLGSLLVSSLSGFSIDNTAGAIPG